MNAQKDLFKSKAEAVCMNCNSFVKLSQHTMDHRLKQTRIGWTSSFVAGLFSFPAAFGVLWAFQRFRDIFAEPQGFVLHPEQGWWMFSAAPLICLLAAAIAIWRRSIRYQKQGGAIYALVSYHRGVCLGVIMGIVIFLLRYSK